VKRLIISGANPDLLSDKGHNALYNVAANIKGEPAETLTQTLLDSGADPMVKSKHSGHTALSAAVRHGNLGMVEKLLEHEDAGQLLTAVSGHGQTPLQLAQELQKMAREEEKRTGISYGEVAADLQREKASPLDEIVRRLETAESRRREAAGDI
jgi:ankyrin repeat protein